MFKKRKHSIGLNIKWFRRGRNYSQVYVAQACGISVKKLSDIENGKIRPDYQLLFELARFFGVSYQAFLYEHGK